MAIEVRPVRGKADEKAFVDLPWRLYAGDPHWSPPLKSEVRGLMNPRSNPWFRHGRAEFWVAWRGSTPVGRISAQVCDLVQRHMGAGTGQWGFLEAEDAPEIFAALFAAADAWQREARMTRTLGPFSLSVWDEVGLLVDGFDRPPEVMMPHALPYYQRHVEALGHAKAHDLLAYRVKHDGFPPTVGRIVELGERNPRLVMRNADSSKFEAEVKLVLGILNEAWAGNWGFVPLTEAEIDYAVKKLKPIIVPEMVKICEYDGVPVAFMLTLPNLNELTADLNGKLYPFNWARLLWRLKFTPTRSCRVALMGVLKRYQGTRFGAQMAFMMIEHTRRFVVRRGTVESEQSWILDNNGPMRSIEDAIDAWVAKTYRVYERAL